MTGGHRAFGNFVPSHGAQSGSGRNGMHTPFGRVTMLGKAGDVKVFNISDIVAVNNPGMSVIVQAIGGDVVVDLTLAPPDLAFNPVQTDIWANPTNVTAGPIVALPFVGSAIRVTFTEDSTVYLAGV